MGRTGQGSRSVNGTLVHTAGLAATTAGRIGASCKTADAT
jgi:hypothetical protein